MPRPAAHAVTASVTRQLAAFAAGLRYKSLPPAAIGLARQLTLDTLGTALAATAADGGCGPVVETMVRLGGAPESTILGRRERVSAPNAAFANGALAHALNFDAIGPLSGHTGVVCFAAPFAVAQSVAPVSGERFLCAVVAAAETTARLTHAAVGGGNRVSPKLLAGQMFGYLGAAAGAGCILGLDAAAMQSAFGLAVMQMAGSRQVVTGGDPPAKAVYGAFPNQAGVLAALLAEAGLGAEMDAIEGPNGFFGITTGGGFDREALLGGLGDRYAFAGVEFKPWPVSAHVAPFIDGAIALRGGPNFDAAGIELIELTGPAHVRDWFEPLAERRRPSNAASAANSAPFAAAAALVHGDVTPANFTAAGLADETTLRMAGRVTYRLDDRGAGGDVTVRMHDGRSLTSSVADALGSAARPLSESRLEAKFRACCAHAGWIAPAAVDAAIAFIGRLEAAADVSALAGYFTPGASDAG